MLSKVWCSQQTLSIEGWMKEQLSFQKEPCFLQRETFVLYCAEAGRWEGLFLMLEAALNTICGACNPAWDIQFLDSRDHNSFIFTHPTVPSPGLYKW